MVAAANAASPSKPVSNETKPAFENPITTHYEFMGPHGMPPPGRSAGGLC